MDGIIESDVRDPSVRNYSTLKADISLEWVHCNFCYAEFLSYNSVRKERIDQTTSEEGIVIYNSTLAFCIFSCSHILCRNCIKKEEESIAFCIICKVPVNSFQLYGPIPLEILHYFQSPAKTIEDTVTILALQQKNSQQLITHLKRKLDKQKDILARAKAELINMKAIKEELKLLREEKERLEEIKEVQCNRATPHPLNIRIAAAKAVGQSPVCKRRTLDYDQNPQFINPVQLDRRFGQTTPIRKSGLTSPMIPKDYDYLSMSRSYYPEESPVHGYQKQENIPAFNSHNRPFYYQPPNSRGGEKKTRVSRPLQQYDPNGSFKSNSSPIVHSIKHGSRQRKHSYL